MLLVDGPGRDIWSSVAAVSGTADRAGRGACVSEEVSSTIYLSQIWDLCSSPMHCPKMTRICHSPEMLDLPSGLGGLLLLALKKDHVFLSTHWGCEQMVNVVSRQPEKLFLGLRNVSSFQPALFLSSFLLFFFFFYGTI